MGKSKRQTSDGEEQETSKYRGGARYRQASDEDAIGKSKRQASG